MSAIALVAHTVSGQAFGGVTATTPAINTTGANFIVLACGWVTGAMTPTDSKGNTYTALTEYSLSSNLQLFYCHNPIVGPSHTFTLTNGSAVFPVIAAQAFSGVGSFDVQNGGTGGPSTQPVPAGPLTPSSDGELLISAEVSANSATATVDSGFTRTDFVANVGHGLGIAMAYLVQEAAATVNPTWTGQGVAIEVATVAAFAPSPAVTLTLSSGTAAPGTPITLTVSIASTGGAAPSAVQWVVSFPLGSISGITGATVGAAAASASKTLTQLGNNFEVFGPNVNVIGDGDIADITFQLTLNNNPVPNPIPIQILSVQASDIHGNLIQSAGVLGDVTSETVSTGCPIPNTATIGAPYFAALAGAGGTAPYTFMVASGLLPTGLTLDASSGQLTGIPTAIGIFNFTIEVMDANGVIYFTDGCSITVSGVTPTNPGLCDNPATDVTLDCYCELTKVLVAFKQNKRLPVRGRS